MRRRELILMVAGASVVTAPQSRAQAVDRIKALLDQFEQDPSLNEKAWLFRDQSVSRGVGAGRPSARAISTYSTEVIIRLEVTSPERYARSYSHPIWPKGASGVTIGVGYDLRFANQAILRRDWQTLLPAADVAKLATVLKLGGTQARDAVPAVRDVTVPWDAARVQFLAFLPYAIATTENTFPNTQSLSDDSMGALVSLIYNRGPAIPPHDPSRKEMVDIRDQMRARRFDAVPTSIRNMKHLWIDNKDAQGVVLRREVEATLFERGLAGPTSG